MRTLQELTAFIKERCKAQGSNISKMEKACGLGNGTINQWEKNAKKIPPHDKLQTVADFLSLSVDELLGKETPPIPQEAERGNPELERLNELLKDADPQKLQEIARYAEFLIGKE